MNQNVNVYLLKFPRIYSRPYKHIETQILKEGLTKWFVVNYSRQINIAFLKYKTKNLEIRCISNLIE